MNNTTLTQIYFGAIKKWWGLLFAATACAIVPAVLYLQNTDSIFETQIRTLIQDNGLAVDASKAHNKDKNFLSTQSEIIRSPLIIKRSFDILPPASTLEIDVDPVVHVTKRLFVSPLVSTDIVRLSYRDSDPERSVLRLQAIIESYQLYLQEIEQSTSDETVELLEKQQITLTQQRDFLEKSLAELREESPFIGESRESIRTETTSLKELANRLVLISSKRSHLESILKTQEHSNSPLSSVAMQIGNINAEMSRSLRDLQSSLSQAQSEAQKLSRVFGPLHPERKQAEDRANALELQYSKALKQAALSMKQELEIAKAEQAHLQTLHDAERNRLSTLDAFLLREEKLNSELERVNQTYESTLAQLRQKQLNKQALADGQVSIVVQVLDEFTIPQNPVWPQPIPLLIACGFLGLLLGFIVIVFIEKLPLPGMQSFDSNIPEETNISGENRVLARRNNLDSYIQQQEKQPQHPQPVSSAGITGETLLR